MFSFERIPGFPGFWAVGLVATTWFFSACSPKSHPASLSEWLGEWNESGGPFDLYSLQIEPDGGNLRFKLEAHSGTHAGLIEGLAKVNGPTALFEETQPWNEGKARVTFQRVGDSIHVHATNVESYGGMGIVFHGRILHRGPPKENPFPLSRGLRPLLTEQEEMDLKQLVTLDYPLLVANLHLANSMNIDTPDFKGKQVDGFVRGMAYERGAMILVDREGRMAAAVTEPDSKEIRLYSQLPGEGVPRPIRDWRSESVEKSFVWVIK